MEELKKDKTYIEAKRDQREGISHIQTSCITCKFKPDYLAAIPCLRAAADAFFGFLKSKPDLYKQNLVLEETQCREKLIECLDKERSLIEAGDQGIKLAKIYINYLRSFDLGYKTMENFNLCFIQSNSLGNNSIQRSLKGISEIAKCFAEQSATDYSQKTYAYLFDTAFSIFPGQVKENEPYEYIYTAFGDYFDSLIARKEFEMLLRDVLKVIELVSPSKEQLLHRESVMGKDNDIDNILKLYYKLLVCCACMEDQEKFDLYCAQANDLKCDSTHEIILDGLRDIFTACMRGEEKSFNRNLTFLDNVLSIQEVKELRSIMRKYKKYEKEDEAPKSPIIGAYQNNNYAKNYENEMPELRRQERNFAEKNLDARIELQNINKEMQGINKDLNENFEKLNQLHDFGQEFKKLTNTSSDLIHRHTEEISQIQPQQPAANERQKKYQIQEEDEEHNEEKDFVVNLDHHGDAVQQQENKSPVHDYL